MELCQHKRYWKKACNMILKEVYGSWVTSCYAGTFILDLRWCILFISIFIMLTNVHKLITLHFYVCRWKMKKMKTINAIKKTFLQITKVMEVARVVTSVLAKNDDQYIWISIEAIVFFEKFVCENQSFWFNVMDILS